MENLLRFVKEHDGDEISRLILDRKKYQGIDIDLAVNCIESRRKLKGKVQQWYDEPSLIFPQNSAAAAPQESIRQMSLQGLPERKTGGLQTLQEDLEWTPGFSPKGHLQ